MTRITRRIFRFGHAEHGCMTLAELSAFLKDCVDCDIPMDATLKVKLKGFRGQLHYIETADPK